MNDVHFIIDSDDEAWNEYGETLFTGKFRKLQSLVKLINYRNFGKSVNCVISVISGVTVKLVNCVTFVNVVNSVISSNNCPQQCQVSSKFTLKSKFGPLTGTSYHGDRMKSF